MYSGFLRFNNIPEIGFAHHFYAENYSSKYGEDKKSFEIVYINSGGIEVDFNGEKFYADEGSIFVLFRHLPLMLRCRDNNPQSHCTVQVKFDYDFRLISDGEFPGNDGVLLPFIIPPCKETEHIKQELYSIVSDMSISRDGNAFSSSLKFLHIMQQLDRIARKKQDTHSSSLSIISYRVKKYVSENIHKAISLSDISNALDKTPGHINHVFKETNGITITQYITKEKIQMLVSLMQNKNLTFKEACFNVGISDISYGYRLFKKHMGITPGEYLSGDIHIHKTYIRN